MRIVQRHGNAERYRGCRRGSLATTPVALPTTSWLDDHERSGSNVAETLAARGRTDRDRADHVGEREPVDEADQVADRRSSSVDRAALFGDDAQAVETLARCTSSPHGLEDREVPEDEKEHQDGPNCGSETASERVAGLAADDDEENHPDDEVDERSSESGAQTSEAQIEGHSFGRHQQRTIHECHRATVGDGEGKRND